MLFPLVVGLVNDDVQVDTGAICTNDVQVMSSFNNFIEEVIAEVELLAVETEGTVMTGSKNIDGTARFFKRTPLALGLSI